MLGGLSDNGTQQHCPIIVQRCPQAFRGPPLPLICSFERNLIGSRTRCVRERKDEEVRLKEDYWEAWQGSGRTAAQRSLASSLYQILVVKVWVFSVTNRAYVEIYDNHMPRSSHATLPILSTVYALHPGTGNESLDIS